MRIQTINTIETSSICDNSCKYCPAPLQKQHRPVGFMPMDVFEKAIEQVFKLAREGTQQELNLFGVGEPMLHPKIVDMVKLARQKLPFKQVLHLNTNGNRMTEELAKKLMDAGISKIDITIHENHEAAARTKRLFEKIRMPFGMSIDPVITPNNWAGQVDWLEPQYEAGPCPWINKGQVMVMSDGRITRCCIDAFAKGVFADISDDLQGLDVTAFELCKTCHHDNPLKTKRQERGLIYALER